MQNLKKYRHMNMTCTEVHEDMIVGNMQITKTASGIHSVQNWPTDQLGSGI